MKKLKSFPSYYLEILAFILIAVNPERGYRAFHHFFPTEKDQVSEWELVARWQIVHEAANEVGFDDVQKVMDKIIGAYKKAGGHRALTPEVTYEVVMERLNRSRKTQEETDIFNAFVQKVCEKI